MTTSDEYKAYYKELLPDAPDWIHQQLAGERVRSNQENENLRYAIRELVVGLTIMRSACEHIEGKTAGETRALLRAVSVGVHLCNDAKLYVPDYEMPSFWKTVGEVGARFTNR